MAAEHMRCTNEQVLAVVVSGMSGLCCGASAACAAGRCRAYTRHASGRPSQLLGDVALQQPVQLLLLADVGVVTLHVSRVSSIWMAARSSRQVHLHGIQATSQCPTGDVHGQGGGD